MEPKKVQKQGRDERTQEDYPTSGVYFCRFRVVFLRSFISALFLYFFRLHPYFKPSFTETFFPRVYTSASFADRLIKLGFERNVTTMAGLVLTSLGATTCVYRTFGVLPVTTLFKCLLSCIVAF